jgi:hypothetical protein
VQDIAQEDETPRKIVIRHRVGGTVYHVSDPEDDESTTTGSMVEAYVWGMASAEFGGRPTLFVLEDL